MTKCFEKKNQGHLTQKPIFTYLCIYLYANIEFPSYRNQYWQHLLQQGLFWQNFISPIYFTLLIASSHLAKNPSCFALLKLLHRLPSSLLLPNNHPSINQIPCSPCKAPPRVLTLPWFSVLIPGLHVPQPGSVCTYVSQLSINGTNKVS